MDKATNPDRGRRNGHQLEDSFFETSIDMLCALDFNMHFRRLSPAWERTPGFTREKLLSRPFIEFVHPQTALSEVKTLREILPICSYCRKIRDDEDYWHTVEHYVSEYTATQFSHSICPSCMATHAEPHAAQSGSE